MPSWTISSEHHFMPQTERGHSIEFFYAIRREDGSLLFRAETMRHAEELIARLVGSHKEVSA